ncbi:MAG: DUF159 family protein [Comamonadaceae bacterium]|nr:MAG: DUF159 family protein [Comamonadaceae bacterium]
MTSTGRPMSTNNCRREGMAKSWTFGPAWRAGQRCLIPARMFQEPYWGPYEAPFAKSIAWHFERADGMPWALAGLYSEWTDRETGEVVPNYTMLTQNCDAHPLMKLMHKPEKDMAGVMLPLDKQDKRSVVPIEPKHWDAWLHGSVEQAEALIGLPDLECIRHRAVDAARQIDLPIQL